MKKSFSKWSGQRPTGLSGDGVYTPPPKPNKPKPTTGVIHGVTVDLSGQPGAISRPAKPTHRPKPVAKPVAKPVPKPAQQSSNAASKPNPSSTQSARPAVPSKPAKPAVQGKVTATFGKPGKGKNDKFLGRGENDKTRQTEAKNKSLIPDFKGARTFKDKDGKIRPTKEWAAHLKKNGSSVVSKSRTKPDHIHQMTNAWKKD